MTEPPYIDGKPVTERNACRFVRERLHSAVGRDGSLLDHSRWMP